MCACHIQNTSNWPLVGHKVVECTVWTLGANSKLLGANRKNSMSRTPITKNLKNINSSNFGTRACFRLFGVVWDQLSKIDFFRNFGRGHQRRSVDTIFPKTIKRDAEMFDMYLPYSKHFKLTFGRPQSRWVHRLDSGCKLKNYWVQTEKILCPGPR